MENHKAFFIVVTIVIAVTFLIAGSGMVFSSSDQPETNNWKITIASDSEPGKRLIVTGQVFENDGTTPVKDAEIFVYQTDAAGYYRDEGNRIGGTMLTNSEGRYEYHTIKPAPYPGGSNPAHVHYKITGKNIPEQWFELQFADDKLLSKAQIEKEMKKGSFSQIQQTTKDSNGTLKCVMDIIIKR